MARVTNKAHPPFIKRGSCATTRAAIGATATAAWFAVATRKGEAHASSAWTGSVWASRSATLAERPARHAATTHCIHARTQTYDLQRH
eukprot:6214798-Pleurochrysis_carterae.AAC.1